MAQGFTVANFRHVADGLGHLVLLAAPRRAAEFAQFRLAVAPADVLLHEVDARRGDVQQRPAAEFEDEVFLVLSGRGTVTFADGGAIDLRPGVLVRLHAGDQTTWTVTERLRKLYLA